MNKIISALLVISFLMMSCAQSEDRKDKPAACTEEAKLCPDGSYVGRGPPNCDFQKCPENTNPGNENTSEREKHYCSPGDKNNKVCIELYDPACGWFDPTHIQCIRYPCARTFSNSCFACADKDVIYWTGGECPAN